MTRVLRDTRQFMAGWPGPGVVAVSGGADSVALLCALKQCSAPLTVAHVNHQLRGEESDGDETFVRELCNALGVECRVKRVDVAALAAGHNLESTARSVRYDFFAAVANEVGAAWIATAHTADDQAETVLHRLVRGTGLQGLRGIARAKGAVGSGQWAENAPVAYAPGSPAAHCPLPTVHLLRPFLSLTRVDVLAYLASINQAYRTDRTNADTRFTRNRIRHDLLPLLKTFNPDVVSALAHLAEHANEAHEAMVAVGRELVAKAERPRAASAIILDVAALRAAPRAVLRAALRMLWEREGWPMSDMGFDAWERAVDVGCCNELACDFPGGITMRQSGRVVQIARRE